MLNSVIQQRLKNYTANKLLRQRFTAEKRINNQLEVKGQQFVNFCSNDYLGIANHPKVKQAFIQAVQEYGLGSGSSALLTGYYKPQYLLEEKMAEFLNRDKALLFNSGYHANLGVLTTLANRQSFIISDKLCHASLLDGVQLSRATHYRFAHNDVTHAAKLLDKAENNSLLITESVFSMEGDISPVNQLAELALKKQALLLVDDAHGIGVLGKTGRGICEYYQLKQNAVPCLIVPLGKAFGSMGAVVAGSAELIEVLLQFSRTYCYTTALPPAIAAATLAALEVLAEENWRREKLNYLIRFFITQAKLRCLPLISEELTPIKSILVSDNHLTLTIKKALAKQGILAAGIRPPTVPINTARLRISLNCLHTEKEIIHLLDAVAEAYAKHK